MSKEVCMYLGPNIPGTIQKARLYRGTKAEVCKELADVIDQYPDVAKLIVPTAKVADARIEISTSGSRLNTVYNKVAKSIVRGNRK